MFIAKAQTVVTVALTVLLAVALAIIVISTGSFSSKGVQTYGNIVNVALCTLTATHWSLQISETWAMRGLGSLSAFVVVIGSAGSVLTGVTFLSHGAVGTLSHNSYAQ